MVMKGERVHDTRQGEANIELSCTDVALAWRVSQDSSCADKRTIALTNFQPWMICTTKQLCDNSVKTKLSPELQFQ